MRRILIILEAVAVGAITGYGLVGVWQDWKTNQEPGSQEPGSIVERFEIHPLSPSKSQGI